MFYIEQCILDQAEVNVSFMKSINVLYAVCGCRNLQIDDEKRSREISSTNIIFQNFLD